MEWKIGTYVLCWTFGLYDFKQVNTSSISAAGLLVAQGLISRKPVEDKARFGQQVIS